MKYLFRHYWISICLIIAVAFLGLMMWLLRFPVTWVLGELLLGAVITVLTVRLERDAAPGKDT
jgi:uncharacterized membrane protein AbrB (regulator of aidB expression)